MQPKDLQPKDLQPKDLQPKEMQPGERQSVPNEGFSPAYNMKVVVQETGLNPMTIRTWERRYGLPNPPRAKGGHRLYSQHDIETLKWLVARQAEGMSVHHAVELWRALATSGQDPLQSAQTIAPTQRSAAPEENTPLIPLVANARTLDTLATSDAQSSNLPGEGASLVGKVHEQEPWQRSEEMPVGQIVHFRQAWLAACRQFDRVAADAVLTQAFALYPAEMVCSEVLAKALAWIGESWHQGESTIQQEHFTSELAIRRLEMLVAAAALPIRSERILVGCAPEDQHTFGPLLLTFLLLRQGWDVIYLGANVPISQLDATIAQVSPQLVILSAQHLYTAATLLQAARWLQQHEIPFGFGGLIFNQVPALRQQVPGHFLGTSLSMAAQQVRVLLETKSTLPSSPDQQKADAISEKTDPLAQAYRQTLRHFLERRALIESHVWSTLLASRKATDALAAMNQAMTQIISAVLKLENVAFLPTPESWQRHLAVNFHLSPDLLQSYFYAYTQAVTLCLVEPNEASAESKSSLTAQIVDWIARL